MIANDLEVHQIKTITLFHLTNCPYCINARTAQDELCKEDPAHSSVQINWIEERQEPVIADKFDYYYVTTIYYEGEKPYEAHPSADYETIKGNVKDALDTVLAAS